MHEEAKRIAAVETEKAKAAEGTTPASEATTTAPTAA